MDTNHRGICTALRHHLFFLNRADTILWIKHNNASPRHIRKTGKRRLSGISGRGSQNNYLLFHIILPCCRCHQVGKNGKCHILKSDCRAVKQFQIMNIIHLSKRHNLRHIKFLVISFIDAVLQFLAGKIS